MSGRSINWNLVDDFERNHAQRLCEWFLPNGEKIGHEWAVGNTAGEPGDSLKVELSGDKAGLWNDHATDEGGRLRKLIAAVRNCTNESVVDEYERALGVSLHYDNGTQQTNQVFKWSPHVDSLANDNTKQQHLGGWRGYSPEFISWLVKSKLIGLSKDDFAFPVINPATGGVIGCHVLINPLKKQWIYFPKGTPAYPLILGDLTTAVQVHVFESTWDGLAFFDRSGEYRGDGVCVVITRGMPHAKKINELSIPAKSEVYAWPQNDGPEKAKNGITPSEKWFKDLRSAINRPFRRVVTPREFEDLNDWTRAGATAQKLCEAMQAAQLIEPVKPQEDEFGPVPPREMLDEKARREQAQAEQIPDWLKPRRVDELTTVAPAVLVEGMICQGDHVLVQGVSKMRKTWFLMQLIYCITNGLPFLEFKTKAVPGVHVDLELREYFCRTRLEKISEMLGGNFDNLRIIPLRGKVHQLSVVRIKQLSQIIKDFGAKFFSFDPLYRLLMGLDENSNSQVAQLFQPFDELSAASDAAFFATHHYAKGNSANKEAIDRSAGAGVFARAPDVIISLTPHQESHCLAVEIIQRNFKEIEPFVVTWDEWLFKRVGELDPKDLKQPTRAGRPSSGHEQIALAALRAGEPDGLTFERWMESTGLSKTSFNRVRKTLLASKDVFQSIATGTYQISANRLKNEKHNEN